MSLARNACMTLMLPVVMAVCIPGLSGCASSSQTDFSPDRVQTVGGSALLGRRLQLVSSRENQTGAVWSSEKQTVASGFETSFSFQVTQKDAALGGGDGFAFVIQNADPKALSGPGGGLGYGGFGRVNAGITNSVAVEFDTLKNNWDPDGNHVSVNTRGMSTNRVEHAYSLGTTSAIPNLKDGRLHTAKIMYSTSGWLDVYVDDLAKPTLRVSIELDKKLSLDNGKAWVGFTAATALARENIEISGWNFTSGAREVPAQSATLRQSNID